MPGLFGKAEPELRSETSSAFDATKISAALRHGADSPTCDLWPHEEEGPKEEKENV